VKISGGEEKVAKGEGGSEEVKGDGEEEVVKVVYDNKVAETYQTCFTRRLNGRE
jgi:hypothetical protein